MRLTVEEDPETIKRYGHVKPGRAWGGGLCSVQCPGTVRTCTLEKRHRGPHVAHGRFKKVVAVWDAGREVRRSAGSVRPSAAPRTPREVWTGGVGGPLQALWSRIVALTPSVGDIALLLLLVGFVVFSIQWFLLIFR